MRSSDDALAVTLAVAAALLAVILSVLVGFSAGPLPATESGPPDPACIEWSDSCVVCSRTPEGMACSTPGIACTKGPPRCLRR
jgi:hypothetical protein